MLLCEMDDSRRTQILVEQRIISTDEAAQLHSDRRCQATRVMVSRGKQQRTSTLYSITRSPALEQEKYASELQTHAGGGACTNPSNHTHSMRETNNKTDIRRPARIPARSLRQTLTNLQQDGRLTARFPATDPNLQQDGRLTWLPWRNALAAPCRG